MEAEYAYDANSALKHLDVAQELIRVLRTYMNELASGEPDWHLILECALRIEAASYEIQEIGFDVKSARKDESIRISITIKRIKD